MINSNIQYFSDASLFLYSYILYASKQSKWMAPWKYSSVLTSLDITYDQSELRQLENSRGKERLYIG